MKLLERVIIVSNCFEYDLDYKFANFNMRSDCIQSCIHEMYMKQLHDDNLISTGHPIIIQLLEQDNIRN